MRGRGVEPGRSDRRQVHKSHNASDLIEINNINSERLCLEVVRVADIKPNDLTVRELQARYEDLAEAGYRWDIKVHGVFTANRRLARLKASIKSLHLRFPEMDNQAFLLLPSGPEFKWCGRKYKNFQQETPRNTAGDEMRFEMWQHFHRFTVLEESGQPHMPDERFWRACRDFLGYRKIYNDRCQKMEMDMRMEVCLPGSIGQTTLYWHSIWDADEYKFEKQLLNGNNQQKKLLVYVTGTHWIDGESNE